VTPKKAPLARVEDAWVVIPQLQQNLVSLV
jgi:hypothetical protein